MFAVVGENAKKDLNVNKIVLRCLQDIYRIAFDRKESILCIHQLSLYVHFTDTGVSGVDAVTRTPTLLEVSAASAVYQTGF